MAVIRGSYPFEKYSQIEKIHDKYDQECVRLNQLLIKWLEEDRICKKNFFNNPICFTVTMKGLEELAPLHAEAVKNKFQKAAGKYQNKMIKSALYGLWENNTERIAIDIDTIQLLKAYQSRTIDRNDLDKLASREFFTPQPDWLVKELTSVQEELIEVISRIKKDEERKEVSQLLANWLKGIREKGFTVTEEEKQLLAEAGITVNPEKLENSPKSR